MFGVFFIAEYIPQYICTSSCIHSSKDGNLGCFHIPAIVNNTAVNAGMYVPFEPCFSQIYAQVLYFSFLGLGVFCFVGIWGGRGLFFI